MAPYLHQFSAVEQEALFFVAIWCKFSIKIKKIYAIYALSESGILDEFSKQASVPKHIAKSTIFNALLVIL